MKLCADCNIHFSEDHDSCPNDGSELISVGNDPLIGELVGDKYRILCHVGKGSMAVVYKVIQESTGREMALKMLHHFLGSKEESVKRFHREAKAVSCLHHTNIIQLFDFGVMPDGQPYIVTEFLDGISLAELIRENGPLTVRESLPLMEQVCAGIAEAHKNRVIHRDLKPDNILLQDVDITQSGPLDIGKNSVRVVDFGVAKMWGESAASSASLTLEGKVCGSPAYMSPEQCKGAEVDTRSDIYTLGVVFFEILTGQRPFAADDLMALMLMHVNKEAPSIGSVLPDVTFPPGLSNVIIKALSKSPDDRYDTVEELWLDVEAACKGRQVQRVADEEPVEEWIPFTGQGSSNISLPTRSGSEWSLNSPSADLAKQAEDSALDWSKTTSEMSAVKKKKWLFPGALLRHTKTVVYLAVVVLSVMYVGRLYTNWNDSKIAMDLYKSGNYEGCIQIVEELERSDTLSDELKAALDDSYYKVARNLGRKRDYKKAVSLLDKISDGSKHAKKARYWRNKYKTRIR